ncbi:MAG: GGDEF domain-containing protein [Caryophanon sp.]|nr:GGDEF domain-containing protein [Caryophanon sp.]
MKRHTDVLFQKVNTHYDEQQYPQFFELIDSAILLAEQEDDVETIVDFTLKKATAYFRFADYEIAIQALHDLDSLIGEQPSEARIRYMNLKAAVYGELNDLESCYQYLCRAKTLAEEQQSFEILMIIEANITHYLFGKARYEEALVHLERAFAICEQIDYERNQLYVSLHARYIRICVQQQRFEEAAARIAYVASYPNVEKQQYYKYFVKAVVVYECAMQQYERAYTRLQEEMKRFAQDERLYDYFYEQFIDVAEHVEPLEQYVKTLETYYDYILAQQKQQQQQRAERIDMYFKVDHLEELTWLDPLTQIKNRRYLQDHASDWLNEVNTAVAVIIFDADHFKKINDTYGHDVGDEVICLMAKCAAAFFDKHNALFVRYGGDEFLALCPVESEDKLISLLQTFQSMMHAQSYSKHETLQISIGATFHEQPINDVEQLIAEADQALYYVKQQGRHHFAIYTHEPNKRDIVRST